MQAKYYIEYRCDGGTWERIDEFSGENTAFAMMHEYRRAFGRDGTLRIMHRGKIVCENTAR